MVDRQLNLLGGRDPGPARLHSRALQRWTYDEVRSAIAFRQAHTQMYGKTIRVPRLECWLGLQPYRYGGQTQEPVPWPPALHAICDAVERRVMPRFDSCFANLYEDGGDSIGWHADDEDWIGPWIASVTFGGTRRFIMRRKDDHRTKHEYALGHGDLLVMPPGTQEVWEHCIPKTKQEVVPRINLTFRQTVGSEPNARGVST